MLHAIVDVDVARRAGWPPADLARAFLEGGARCVQIRGKNMSSAQFLELCDTVVTMAKVHEATVIVNDRVDLALMSHASGVHVGQDDLAPSLARRIVGEDAVIGLSTHTVAQVQAALNEPISYLAVGPVFGTRTKETGYEAVGLNFVSIAARLAGRLPVVAIGGVTLQNARSVIDAGAAAVAVIGDLLHAPDVPGRVSAYVRALA